MTLNKSVFYPILIPFFVLGLGVYSYGQNTNDSIPENKILNDTLKQIDSFKLKTSPLGKIKFPSFKKSYKKYIYDPINDVYKYAGTLADYDASIPLVISRKEYEKLATKESQNTFFSYKTKVLEGNVDNLKEAQKELSPDSYINKDFFKNIFGSEEIKIDPYGVLGVDIGVRYFRNDNPALSLRNRENITIDFDADINVGMTGNIGDRIRFTGNFDTESSFDFQNLLKIEFNPPKLLSPEQIAQNIIEDQQQKLTEQINKKLDSITPNYDTYLEKVDSLQTKYSEMKNAYEENKQKLQNLDQGLLEAKEQINEYLNQPANEDAIIQNFDIGNINMRTNSILIPGIQNLFGAKAELKFGRTNITAVYAQQNSQSQTINVRGGGLTQEYNISALDYEDNKHFFLSHYFRDTYNSSLANYPYINSSVQITRIEIWVTNRVNNTDSNRNILAIQDLGEAQPDKVSLDAYTSSFFNPNNRNIYPKNEANNLNPKRIGVESILTEEIRNISSVKQGFGVLSSYVKEGNDYSVLENARKLSENEFTFHSQLGYISLNQSLNNDEVLAVAFQYSIDGKVYQVGEFANDGIVNTSLETISGSQVVPNSNNLVLKMLKSTIVNVNQPVWDLMMKNIYSIGAYQISEEDFNVNIFYADPSPLNYITPVDASIWPSSLNNRILLNVFNWDKLDSYKDPVAKGDGYFDFIPDITVNATKGQLIFTTIEPFGETLFNLLDNPKSSIESYENEDSYNKNQEKYVFKNLYDQTKAFALEENEKNKFQIRGSYKTSQGGDIPIGAFNIPKGSVRVTVGSRVLQEGVDYIVNYQLGTVKIIDEYIKSSNTPINISLESSSFINQNNKRFAGVDVVHQINNNFFIGGTFLNLRENTFSQKANYGQEPINNTMLGMNLNFSKKAPFLTRLINKFPTIETEAPSRVSFRGEVAGLFAGNPKNAQFNGEATTYIDDFEAAQSNIDIRGAFSWQIASVPFEGVNGADAGMGDLSSGFYRAKVAWYNIDPIFYGGSRPDDITLDEISKNTTRRVFINEIFPEQDLVQGQNSIQSTLDIAYFPTEKGPYNNRKSVDVVKTPSQNWAGIMRPITTTNFEQANVEFIEFWLLDTFSELDSTSDDLGEIVFHLGDVSEDILKDGHKQFENGLPTSNNEPAKNTIWGKVPLKQSLLYTFSTDINERSIQDVGLDGINDAQEFFIYNSDGNRKDPAGDNYEFYLGRSGDIVNRYKNYNGTEKNSPITITESNRGSTVQPDTEDINRDQTMNTIERYFKYKIPIAKNMNIENHPFITDIRDNVVVDLPNSEKLTTRWIQFKIPIAKSYYEGTNFNSYFEAVNGIEDARSIRFIRMVLGNFSQPVVFRFGTLDLVRGEWRRYERQINENISQSVETTMDISTVNILENEDRIPINYVLPPGVIREENNNNNTIVRQSEQSLAFRVCDLQPQDSRAIYKNVDLDIRQYKSLKMFLHAESITGKNPLPGEGANEDFDDRLVAFIRFGTDAKDNYYQIEVPLKPTSFTPNVPNRLSAEEVWKPESNSIDIPIELFSKLKSLSISKGQIGNLNYYDESFKEIQEFTSISELVGTKKYKYAIKGNPSTSNIQFIMIGLKNPAPQTGGDLCGEVWFNELRLAGIENTEGFAMISSLDTNISDVINISASGKFSSPGFGSIEQTPNQRSQEEIWQYDFITSTNLGKFFPKKWQFNIPFNYSINESRAIPKYSPFYLDVLLDDILNQAEGGAQRDSLFNQAVTYSNNRSINFIGVQKNKTKRKRIYDIENVNFSYIYNEGIYRDFQIEDRRNKKISLVANYRYNFQPKEISIFGSQNALKRSKYFRWLGELNINILPSNLEYTLNINRNFESQRFRQVNISGVDSDAQLSLPALQQRNYTFTRNFFLNHNITKSLRLTFNVSNNSIIKNYFIQGNNDELKDIDTSKDIWDGFWDRGTPNNHLQSITLNYAIPLSYFPFLDFVNANYSYTGDFSWQRGSEAMALITNADGDRLGNVNTIQNANTQTFNMFFVMNKLYNTLGLNKKSESKVLNVFKGVLTFLDRVQINYTENNGRVIPGYLNNVSFFDINPSPSFVFGLQDNIRFDLANQGKLTDFPYFNQPFTKVHNNRLNGTAQANFLKNFIITLNANLSYSDSYKENFLVENNRYQILNPNQFGNFSSSTSLISTAFFTRNKEYNPNFEQFKENRIVIARRLAQQKGIDISNTNNANFPEGFDNTNQQVIIPAFLSAYMGINPEEIKLNPIRRIPIPNWNIRYIGLTKNKWIKKYFTRLSLTHGYTANYTINNYQTNLLYDINDQNIKDQGGNFLNPLLYNNITLSEQFNPLIQIDIETKSGIKFLTNIKKNRVLSLSLDNHLLTENLGDEYTLGMGYRISNFRKKRPKNGSGVNNGDLNLKFEGSYRDNITVIRNLAYENNIIKAGQNILAMRFTADYIFSNELTGILFYDHNFTSHAISTIFPQTNISTGVTIKWTIGNSTR